MSSQCWCTKCAGKIVCRTTFISHGRKYVPDPPRKRRADDLTLSSMPMDVAPGEDDYPDEHNYNSSSSDSDEEESFLGVPVAELNNEDGARPRVGPSALSAEELVVFLLDWMHGHKITDAAGKDIWKLFKAILPSDVDMGTFSRVKNFMRKFEYKAVRRIDICVNNCVVFWNSKNLPRSFRSLHAHRTRCPVCGEPRYVTDPATKKDTARKVVYHFPLAAYIRGLFSRKDLAQHLSHTHGYRPDSHIVLSRGFKEKVLDNPNMQGDARNIGTLLHYVYVVYVLVFYVRILV